jgi:uncharacterized membrane protein
LVGYALGAAFLYAGLAGDVPPSWTTADGRTVWLGRPIAAFLLPTAALVIDWLLRPLSVDRGATPSEQRAGLAIYDALVAHVTLLVVGLHAVVLAALAGLLWGRDWAALIVPVMLGLAMIAIGNLLPKTRPNLAIGIRTRQTLADRACWSRTHRRAGYVLVACGAIIVVAALALPHPFGPRSVLLVGPCWVACTWLLVWRSSRHVAA